MQSTNALSRNDQAPASLFREYGQPRATFATSPKHTGARGRKAGSKAIAAVALALTIALLWTLCLLGEASSAPVQEIAQTNASLSEASTTAKPTPKPKPKPKQKPYRSCNAVDWDFTQTREPTEFYYEVARRGQSQKDIDAGGIVCWQKNWYCSHNWSEGWRFFDLVPGDIVHIDGQDVTIAGRAYYALYETVGVIRGDLGSDKVLFQTCLPDHTGIVIYFGNPV